jgi:hypothetical protein
VKSVTIWPRGSRMEQAAYVLEVLQIIEGAYGAVQLALEEKAEREANKGRPGGQMHSRG